MESTITNQVTPNQQKNTKNKLILFLSLILFVVAISGFGVFFTLRTSQPSSAETTQVVEDIPGSNETPEVVEDSYIPQLESTQGWLTYRNVKHNFSFQYPKDLESLARDIRNGSEVSLDEASDYVSFFEAGKKDAPPFFVVMFLSNEASISGQIMEEVLVGKNVKALQNMGTFANVDNYQVTSASSSGVLDLYVSKDEINRDKANTILSTFSLN